jgi:uncharacterized membrane protein YdjX (TVP38/TMEM64 family)
VEQAGGKSGSALRAIESLQGAARTLKPLVELRDWPDSVVGLAALADLDKPVSMELLMERTAAPAARSAALQPWRILLATVAALVLLAALWRFTPLARYATAERVIDLAERFSSLWWAPPLLIAAYTPACLTMFPRPLITLFAIVAFGAYVGSAYAMAGILVAAASTYWMGTWLPPATVRRLAGSKLNSISEILRERGLLAVTALRLVPLAPFAVEGLVAGAIRIKFRHFLLGTFFGTLPGTFTTTVFGQQISAGLRDPQRINYWVIAGVVLLLAAGSWGVKRWLFSGTPRHRSDSPARSPDRAPAA